MIYTAPTALNSCMECRAIDQTGIRLAIRCARLDAPSENLTIAAAESVNKSLVFGPSIVRKKCPCPHRCVHALPVANIVNRLWYGRALVSLRTYFQVSNREVACQAITGEKGCSAGTN